MRAIERFLKDESGLETVEYAVMVGLMAAVLVAAIVYLRDAIVKAFKAIADVVSPPAPTT
jgi:Flp pilus assembly pilin Flp